MRFGVQALASGLTAGDTFTDLQAASFAADDSPFNTAASNTTETVMGVIEGVVINGATPGRLTLHWTQLASSATATTILANSFL